MSCSKAATSPLRIRWTIEATAAMSCERLVSAMRDIDSADWMMSSIINYYRGGGENVEASLKIVSHNQPALHHAIAALCDIAAPLDSTQTADKKRRCRDETRTVEVFAPGGSLADTEWDGHIRAIIRVNRDILTRSASTGLWRNTSETALFVSDVVLPAAQCAKAIRDHWHIENRSHYVRDGSFAEDASRIRCNPGIFARLRSFAANILRFNGMHNVSDGRHRIAFGGISAILAMRVMY